MTSILNQNSNVDHLILFIKIPNRKKERKDIFEDEEDYEEGEVSDYRDSESDWSSILI